MFKTFFVTTYIPNFISKFLGMISITFSDFAIGK